MKDLEQVSVEEPPSFLYLKDETIRDTNGHRFFLLAERGQQFKEDDPFGFITREGLKKTLSENSATA